MAQDGACEVGSPTATIAESLAILGRRVRTLFDFIEKLKWPPYRKCTIDIRLYVHAHQAKTLTAKSEKNSSTLGVVRVGRRLRRKCLQHREKRSDRRYGVGDETVSGNMAVMTATGDSTASPYWTPIPSTGLSAAISTQENYFRFSPNRKYYYRTSADLLHGLTRSTSHRRTFNAHLGRKTVADSHFRPNRK